MKRFTILLAMLVSGFALPLLAQTAADPVENIIVTAPKLRPEDALNSFIIAHAAPSPLLGKIARWKTGICPVTVGLTPSLNRYITQRIVRVAMMAGVPLDAHEPCKPNIAVLATTQPQALLDFVRSRRPSLLGFHYRSHAQQLATMRRPIQAWYSTATEDFFGLLTADLPSGSLGYGAMSSMGEVQMANVSGARTSDGLKSEFTAAIIVVDTSKIVGQEIGPLSDYIAMLALAQAKSYDDCQDVPTITNLLATGCSAELRPAALTDIDATYLRGLYRMDPGNSYLGERASIAYAMKKDLGGY